MASYSSFKKINSEAIINSAVTGAKLAALAVNANKINANAVAIADIQDGAVGTAQISSTLNLSGKTVSYRPFVNADFANTTIAGGKLASGAATANLGYTPVNRAGSTMSGQLNLAAGSAGAPALTFSGDTDTGIHFPAGDNISISTAGSNRLIIDSSGRGREPERPAFHGAGTGGWYYWNSFGGSGWREININWQITQQGGNNCSNNGRFTAPVAGYYWFYLQSYYYNDTNGTPGYTHWNIGRNGSPSTSVSSRHPHSMFSHGQPNNHTPGIMTASQFFMNAGDYSSPQPYGPNGPGRFHGDHSLWCGFLIG